jgi:two-component system NarL family sensor kinase
MDDEAVQALIQAISSDPLIDLNARRAEILQLLQHLSHKNMEEEMPLQTGGRLRSSDDVAVRIHNGPLQELAIALRLAQDAGEVSDAVSLRQYFASFIVSVSTEIAGIRRILLSDTGTRVQRHDLLTRLLDFSRTVEGVRIGLSIQGDDPGDDEWLQMVSPDMSNIIFRFAQETIRNAQRHGGATELRITITKNRDRLTVQTVDNGTGFRIPPPVNRTDYQDLADDGHVGLRFLIDMIAPFDGKLRFQEHGAALGGALVELEMRL